MHTLWHRTGSQGEGSTLSRLRLCARLERGWALRGTAGAKRKEVYPRYLQLGEAPAYHAIPFQSDQDITFWSQIAKTGQVSVQKVGCLSPSQILKMHPVKYFEI